MSRDKKKGIYKLSCGCIVERGTERVLEQCAPCAAEFNDRHERARDDYATAHPRVFVPGGLPVSEFQTNIRTAVAP